MSYKVLLHPKAAQFLEKVDASLKERTKKQLRELESSPDEKGERLKYSSFWRLRIDDYRAIYEIDRRRKRVVILLIGHRKRIYDDFSKLL